MDEYRRALFQVIESIAKHNKLLVQQYKDIISSLLPILLSKLDSDSADVRFQALKSFTDLLTQYLCEERIYNADNDT